MKLKRRQSKKQRPNEVHGDQDGNVYAANRRNDVHPLVIFFIRVHG